MIAQLINHPKMIAKVNTTSHITRSVMYGQNEQKGGEVLLYNFVDMAATPDEQAADLNAMSNPYRVKAYNIILSFDNKDTEILRQMTELKRFTFERDVIRAFIEEMVRRGTNLMDCPFVVARHGNTDNEHFHMTVLTTTIDGHRIHDSFIKKNAIRSAACISERYGLRAAPMALRNEIAHQVAEEETTTTRRPRRVHNHQPVTMVNIQDRIRRRDAIERANRRKEKLRKLIEKIAKEAAAADFAKRLKAEGMTLCQKKKEWGVKVMLEDGKERTYTFGQLLVKSELVAPLLVVPKVTDEKPAERSVTMAKPTMERGVGKTHKASSFPFSPITNAVRQTGRLLKADTGQSGGQSREDEVSKGSYEEPEENVRRGGMRR